MRMNRSKIILIVTFFFNLSLSWGNENCAPVAQFSTLGKVKPSSANFTTWTIKPTISESQINSAKCKKINKTLSADKYKLLQDFAKSKKPVLALMEKLSENQNSYCLVDVLVPETVFPQQWINQDDECSKKNLAKVVFKENRKSFYFDRSQLQILSSRKPERSRPRR